MTRVKKSLGQNFLIDKNILEKIINITLGLPFIRISPDHGPNQKMLGQNKSNPLSLVRAIEFLEKNWLKQKKV